MKSLTFSSLISALNLHFAQKLLRKAKSARGCWNHKKLPQTPKVAQKLPNTIRKGLIVNSLLTPHLPLTSYCSTSTKNPSLPTLYPLS